MKKSIYLFFLFFSFHIVSAQNVKQSPTDIIDQKLKLITEKINSNQKKQEIPLLQLKSESEKLGYTRGILQSGSFLMKLYIDSGKNKETIQLGEQLKKIARGERDKYGYISNIYRINALALGYLGLADACLKDYKTAILYAVDIENNARRAYYLSICYENINGYYENKLLDNKKYADTILHNLKKSLEEVKLIKDNNGTVPNDLKYDQLSFIDMSIGMHYLQRQDIKSAEKYLFEGLKIHENKQYTIPADNKIMMLNQVSWLYSEMKDYQKSINFAKRALELEKQFSDPYHRVESFKFLADSYLEIRENEESKFYMNQYSSLKDSLSYVDKHNANITMKKMVSDMDVEYKENYNKQLSMIGALVLIFAMGTIVLWKRKNKIYHKKYEEMIAKIHDSTLLSNHDTIPETTGMVSENNDTRSPIVPNETVKVLLQKLDRFEALEKYLKKEANLTWLANNLNTNTRYLSEIIRIYRDKNFADYINGLRIDYIVNKLYNEPKYRQYKISSLAEECGFASSRVFVNAFKKINEVPPSYFIDQLKQDESAR